MTLGLFINYVRNQTVADSLNLVAQSWEKRRKETGAPSLTVSCDRLMIWVIWIHVYVVEEITTTYCCKCTRFLGEVTHNALFWSNVMLKHLHLPFSAFVKWWLLLKCTKIFMSHLFPFLYFKWWFGYLRRSILFVGPSDDENMSNMLTVLCAAWTVYICINLSRATSCIYETFAWFAWLINHQPTVLFT